MIQFWRFAPLKTLVWASLNQRDIASGQESIDMPMLSTVMGSQSMQSIYTSLIPAQKINFLCSPIEICAGEDCFDSGTDFLAQ